MSNNEKSSVVLTDAEIKKVLECCGSKDMITPCPKDCPMHKYNGDCFDLMQRDILDLINRKDAEIEKLQKVGKEAVSCFHRMESLYRHAVLNMDAVAKYARMKPNEIINYIGSKPAYGWHISNLVIYDKPKDLKKFHKPCVVNPCVNRNFCSTGNTFCPTCTIKKPPQSWCYVERVG